MSRISILDPTASPPDVNADPGPSITSEDFAGSHVDIRYDLTWRSFEWVKAEWNSLFSDSGASVAEWCAGDRTGEEAERTRQALERFSADQEVVISGLGN